MEGLEEGVGEQLKQIASKMDELFEWKEDKETIDSQLIKETDELEQKVMVRLAVWR